MSALGRVLSLNLPQSSSPAGSLVPRVIGKVSVPPRIVRGFTSVVSGRSGHVGSDRAPMETLVQCPAVGHSPPLPSGTRVSLVDVPPHEVDRDPQGPTSHLTSPTLTRSPPFSPLYLSCPHPSPTTGLPENFGLSCLRYPKPVKRNDFPLLFVLFCFV